MQKINLTLLNGFSLALDVKAGINKNQFYILKRSEQFIFPLLSPLKCFILKSDQSNGVYGEFTLFSRQRQRREYF